ncbi:unnamed protein product [Peniophora sp. CBMAI 1063]|nr:unnamed protein product [Peniophora sp. CBMAI 1063]
MSKNLPLEIEEAKPPTWLPTAHATADLGLVGYYPPFPNQPEDEMSTTAVQGGLQTKDPVGAPTWGTKDIANRSFTQERALLDLQKLFEQVFERKVDAAAPIPPSTFRLPSRVTLNDSRRQAWFRQLADSNVPLYTLGKSVPHGAKGQDLLEMLYSNNVEISRAVWFVRVLGANEMAGLRNKPNYDPTQYSVEWSNVVVGYLKKQLGEIVLPSAPRAGVNIKQGFKGVLADPDSHQRWVSRFQYTLALLRTFYSEGLVDNRTFLAWLVTQLATCNLAQAGFVARLCDEYIDGLLSCRALARPFVEACLAKSAEIDSSLSSTTLAPMSQSLRTSLRRASLTIPDALIGPRMWLTYSEVMTKRLTGGICATPESGDSEFNTRGLAVLGLITDNLADIARRNNALLFRNLPPRTVAQLTEAVADVTRLNSISIETNIDNFIYLDAPTRSPVFARKVERLLTWAVTPLQFGDHRPYAAATLLQRWRERLVPRSRSRDQDTLQDLLFEFLDANEPNAQSLPAIALLYGELVKSGLFSYELYIQRLIARCEPGLSFSDVSGSRHRDYLRWIPLDKSTSAIIHQRKTILHGVRTRETPEENNEREMRREIRPLFPELFEGVEMGMIVEDSTVDLLSGCTKLLSAPRYEQVRVVKAWLSPILIKHFSGRLDDPVFVIGALRPFCMAIDLLERLQCYRTMFDLCMALLAHTSTADFLTTLIETLRRFMDIWACMGVLKPLADALYTTHLACKARTIHPRPLFDLLVKIDETHQLDADARASVDAEKITFAQAIGPKDETMPPPEVPPRLPDILMLPADTRPGAVSMLAASLWFRYRAAPSWAWTVWDNTFASLCLKPDLDTAVSAQDRAFCYADFMLHIDQHLAKGLDPVIADWLTQCGTLELVVIDSEAWDSVIFTLLYLVVHGALTATTVLAHLVYPLWKRALEVFNGHQPKENEQPPEVYLRAAHDVFARLLLNTACTPDGIPPNTFIDLQRIATRRQDVFRTEHLKPLVSQIPTLVFLEKSRGVSGELGELSGAIRGAVCEVPAFRQGVYRDLHAVRGAFEGALELNSLDEALIDHLMDALRLILNVAKTDTASISSSDWLDTSALLSPWKLAATAIEVQFTLKQMGERLAFGTPHIQGNTKVDRLIAKLLRHHMSSEQADFVAEMARGVGPTIVGKFVNTGLKFIANTLNGADYRECGSHDAMNVVSEQLRLLAHITEPVRNAGEQPHTDSSTQDEYFQALATKIEVYESLLAGRTALPSCMSQEQLKQGAILLARLLQFDLTCRAAWTPKARSLSDGLCASVFKMAMAFAHGVYLCPVAYALVLDTYYYLLDEMAADSKPVGNDLFKHYPDFKLVELPVDMPKRYKQQIRFLLPYVPVNEAVSNLVYTWRDADDKLVFGPAVVSRPWEWAENIGEASTASEDIEERRKMHIPPIKNSGSISLDLFGAAGKGEMLLDYEDDQVAANMRSFHDSVASESVFTRDWIESRLSFDDDPSVGARVARGEDDELGALPIFSGASPAPSTRSRGSGPSGSAPPSRFHSPFSRISGATMSEAIDVDALTGSASVSSAAGRQTGGKRKASSLREGSDSDIEIVDGPPIPRPKGKGKTAANTRTKRK